MIIVDEVYTDLMERLERIEQTRADQRKFVTIAEAAHRVSLSESAIRQMIRDRKLQALRPVRGRILLSVAELDAAVLRSTAPIVGGRGRPRKAKATV
jgi:excisionase family DNA binding protein